MQIQPKTLLVPPDLQYEAVRILDSELQPEDDTNAVNPLSKTGLTLQVWDYLTDTDAWFLLADKSNHKLTIYDREPFTTSHIFDFDTGDIKFKGKERFSSLWGDPRGMFGSQESKNPGRRKRAATIGGGE